MRRFRAGLLLASLLTIVLGFAGSTAPAVAADPPTASSSCGLGGNVKHVIYIQFDNVHLRRDAANVYGPNSPQALETGEQQYADFVGIGVHCARGSNVCVANGVQDVLPSSPLTPATRPCSATTAGIVSSSSDDESAYQRTGANLAQISAANHLLDRIHDLAS